MWWAVREVYENTLVLGHFGETLFEIYVGASRVKSINVNASIFGFIIPPVSVFPVGCPPPDSVMPHKLVAFDNEKYIVIDLEEEDETKAVRTLFDIHTGIGGYMPRYMHRRIANPRRIITMENIGAQQDMERNGTVELSQ